jgi:hypothetical protein
LVLLATVVIVSASLVAFLAHYFFDLDMPIITGLLTGALTSTPGLAAAIETTNSPLVSIGYGVAYPFGVIGVILFVKFYPKIIRSDIKKAEEEYEKISTEGHPEIKHFNLRVENENVIGKTIGELRVRSMTQAVISRVMGSRDYDSALMKLDIGTEPTLMNAIFLSSGSMHIWNPGQSKPATTWEAEIDQWMGLQAVTPDPTERLKIFHQVQRSLADQAVLIPLVHNNVLAAWQSDFRNIRPAQIFPFTLWNVWEISRIEETSN